MYERSQGIEKKSDIKKGSSAPKARNTEFSPSTSSPASHILSLQRTIGNQAVQRLIESGAIQAKLKIGQPNDKYEQEADRVADEVMRMPEPRVQRQPEEEEEELLQAKPISEQITPLVQRQVEEEEEEFLQAKELTGQTSEISPNLESRINATKGDGQPLPESDRAFFEPRFGYDFSQVRAHTDAEADTLNRALNARAFTTGQDIFFRRGEYTLVSSSGRKLLAHELTHVVQQRGGSLSILGKLRIGQPVNDYKKVSENFDDKKRKSNIRNSVKTDTDLWMSSQKLGYLGEGRLEPMVENHAALLTDLRISHPANTGRKARVVTQLQRNYGNTYVQCILARIQTQKYRHSSGDRHDVENADEPNRRPEALETKESLTALTPKKVSASPFRYIVQLTLSAEDRRLLQQMASDPTRALRTLNSGLQQLQRILDRGSRMWYQREARTAQELSGQQALMGRISSSLGRVRDTMVRVQAVAEVARDAAALNEAFSSISSEDDYGPEDMRVIATRFQVFGNTLASHTGIFNRVPGLGQYVRNLIRGATACGSAAIRLYAQHFERIEEESRSEEYGRGVHGRPIFDVYVTGTVTNPPSDLRVCLNNVRAIDATGSRIVMPGVAGERRYYFQRFFQTDRQGCFHIRVQTEVPTQQSRMEAEVLYIPLNGTSVRRSIDLYWEEAGGGRRRLSGVAPEVSLSVPR